MNEIYIHRDSLPFLWIVRINFKGICVRLCSIEHFYIFMNNSGLFNCSIHLPSVLSYRYNINLQILSNYYQQWLLPNIWFHLDTSGSFANASNVRLVQKPNVTIAQCRKYLRIQELESLLMNQNNISLLPR